MHKSLLFLLPSEAIELAKLRKLASQPKVLGNMTKTKLARLQALEQKQLLIDESRKEVLRHG